MRTFHAILSSEKGTISEFRHADRNGREMSMGQLTQDVIAIRARLNQLVARTSPAHPADMQMPDAIVLAMYERTRSLYRAVWVLLGQGFALESFILLRSLFEDLVRLKQFEVAGTERAKHILSWLLTSLASQEILLCEAQRRSSHDTPLPALTLLRQRHEEIEVFQQTHGIDRVPKLASVKTAARRVGLENDFWTYQLAHHMLHGSETTHRLRQERNAVYFAPVPLVFKTVDRGSAIYAMKWFLLSHAATSTMLDWLTDGESDTVLLDIEGLIAADAEAAS
jgi:hypothetical protein